MKQGGSIAELGNEAFGVSCRAPSPRSSCHAGEDAEARWPRQAGDLAGRRTEQERRTCERQLAPKSLHQQAETPRNGRKALFHPRMPTGTAPNSRLAAMVGACERPAQIDLDDLVAFGAVLWRCGTARSDGGRLPFPYPSAGALSLPEGDPGFPRWCRILPCPKGLPCPEVGMTRSPQGGHRVPVGAIQGSFTPAPRPASLPDEG